MSPRSGRGRAARDGRRALVVEILESFGYICATTTFDLMVTDGVMPGGDGSALAREAVVRQPGLRVLYTSGYTPESISHLDLEGSETAFLAKPFSAADLARSVRRLLDLPAQAALEPLVPA